ncbi:MAG: hypothetical protein ACLVKO_06910 [Dysgonomonas sp.]
MLNGIYFIDKVDLWKTFGAAILKGGYNSLLSYPKRKTPDYDNWYERNGLDVDYGNPVFEAKDVAIRVGLYAKDRETLLKNAKAFEDFLLEKTRNYGYVNLLVKGVSTKIKLRYKGAENAEAGGIIGNGQHYLEQDLMFSDDSPTNLFFNRRTGVFDYTFDHTFTESIMTLETKTFDSTFDDTFNGDAFKAKPKPYDYLVFNHFDLNEIPIRDFGMAFTSYNSGMMVFDILKEPLQNIYSNRSGIEEFSLQQTGKNICPRVKERYMDIGIVMASDNINTLIKNYTLLFLELSKPKPVTIRNLSTETVYKGFYSEQSETELYISDRLKTLEFNLQFVITEKI